MQQQWQLGNLGHGSSEWEAGWENLAAMGDVCSTSILMSITDAAGGDQDWPQKNKCLLINNGMNCGVPLLESQGQSLPAGDFGQFMENYFFHGRK